ncbi:MAG TPA: guanylate kinase [Kosmotogaceae bacterium]|nr:MAG: Guanylate kinase [Thermotogales bacterium 46_20]HAA85084.1 guanylate kinase [Kosmotogaceae bacterium]
MTGSLFVVSGPSGTGKTTILRRVLASRKDLVFSVSYTTRVKRPGEEEGKDYFFVSEEQFEARIRNGEFIEWARVHDNLYGTSREYVDSRLDDGINVVLDIDVQGALNVQKERPRAVYIFIAPPSYEELKNRLETRGTENTEQLKIRLRNARWELSKIYMFQYVVVNCCLDRSVEQLDAIVTSEQLRVEKMKDILHRAGLDFSEVRHDDN